MFFQNLSDCPKPRACQHAPYMNSDSFNSICAICEICGFNVVAFESSYTSFFAICSSRISFTVSGTMGMPQAYRQGTMYARKNGGKKNTKRISNKEHPTLKGEGRGRTARSDHGLASNPWHMTAQSNGMAVWPLPSLSLSLCSRRSEFPRRGGRPPR
jgi:hypothetical protein